MDAWKKNDEIKMINVTDCFGTYYCLTGSKWRPSFVIATKDGTLVLKAQVSKIEAMLNVSILAKWNIENQLIRAT